MKHLLHPAPHVVAPRSLGAMLIAAAVLAACGGDGGRSDRQIALAVE